LNALPNFIIEIDGLNNHFIHVRSKHENALPIIVTEGRLYRWIVFVLVAVAVLSGIGLPGGRIWTRRQRKPSISNGTTAMSV
jgi:hypothetical protein